MKLKQKLLSNEKFYDVLSWGYRLFGANKAKTKGNLIRINGTKLRKTKILITGNNNEIYIGRKACLNECLISIVGSNCKIYIGEAVIMNKDSLIIEDNNGCMKIGNRVVMMENSHIAVTEGCTISIGDECLFAEGITIRSGDSHAIFDMEGNRINHAKDVYLQEHIWVGNRSMILKGVTIGKDSVIGANAVVTKAMPSNVVIAGNPARIVKQNVNWNFER